MGENTNERGWLLIIRSSNVGFNEHILRPGHNKLGRDSDNDCIIHDNAASGHHADIYVNANSDSVTNPVTLYELSP